MKAWVLGWGPAALWAAVLFLLSELEGLGLSAPTGVDKLAHGGLYLIMGLSLAWGKRRTGAGIPGLLLLLMGVAYGALDEWHQNFVPGRYSTVGDWVADSAGVMLGLVLFSRFSSRSSDAWSSPNGRGMPSEGATTTGSAVKAVEEVQRVAHRALVRVQTRRRDAGSTAQPLCAHGRE